MKRIIQAAIPLLVSGSALAHPGHGVPVGDDLLAALTHALSMGHAGPWVLLGLFTVLGLHGAGLGIARVWRHLRR
jgi:hypothetical protein